MMVSWLLMCMMRTAAKDRTVDHGRITESSEWFELTFLTLVLSLGYLDVVTQNFRPFALPTVVQNINENQNPIIYRKVLTLPGDSVECALAQSFPWRSSL